MFRNYFKTAYRSLKKNKATSLINVLGLSIGISAALIIFLIIQHENSFGKWESNKENIFRVYTQWSKDGTNPGISTVAPKEIANKVTGLDAVAHFIRNAMDDATIEIPKTQSKPRKVFNSIKGVVFADADYFNIFDTKWIGGNSQSLNKLNNVVLSASDARLFFPDISFPNIIGQQLIFNDSIKTIVSGVVADNNYTTDFKNKIFISLKTATETSLINSLVGNPLWTNVSDASQCFVRLHNGSSSENVAKQIKNIFESNIKKEGSEDFVNYGRLQPLSNVHFNTLLNGDGAKKNLRNIALLAGVLILLAGINFVNLTTAQASLRAKEVGVRKTFGSDKKQIIMQFLSETFLLMILSTILALLLYPILFRLFKDFIPEGMPITTIFQPLAAIYLLVLIVVLTLLAGIYPSLVLSRYRPIQALRGVVKGNGKSDKIWLRQSLIVFQFIIAQVFLIIVFVVGKQIHYVLNKDMGFKKDAIVSFYTPDWSDRSKYKKINVLANEIKRISGIKDVSIASGTPAFNGWNSTRLTYSDKGVEKEFKNVHVRTIDNNYLDVFGLKMLAGSNVKIDTSAKIPDVLINETLMKQIGFASAKDAVGNYLRGGNADSSKIVGVVKDFSTMSLMSAVQPTILFANDFGYANTLAFSFSTNNPEDWNKTIKKVETAFNKLYVGKTFDYNFYDKTIESLYQSQIRLSTLLKWATGLSIFISCMGLIGLVMFMANQRTKEIGIRKVLGASIPQILRLLSNNLIGLIVLASVVAFPIAWFFSHSWLQDFSYKTTLSWWIFPVCAVGMLLIALAILWSWSLKAAKANPAKVLRTE